MYRYSFFTSCSQCEDLALELLNLMRFLLHKVVSTQIESSPFLLQNYSCAVYILRTSLIISKKKSIYCLYLFLISWFQLSLDHNQEAAICILFLLVICNNIIGRILHGKKWNCHDYIVITTIPSINFIIFGV